MSSSTRRIMVINMVALGGLFLIITILRLNYPLKGMMLVEEWDLPYVIEKGTPPLLQFTQQTFTTRPLLMGSFLAGYLLTPGSYVGMNFVLLISMLASGAALYAILTRLVPNWRLGAFLVAALFLVHPADEYLYTLRSQANHVAVLLWLIAARLLIVYFDKPTGLRLLGMWLAIIISLLNYEIGYPLMLATALLPFLLERRLSRRVVISMLLFGLGIGIAAIIALGLYLTIPKTYVEQMLTSSDPLLSLATFKAMIAEGLRMLRRTFFDGWHLAVIHSALLLPLLLITALTVGLTGRAVRSTTKDERANLPTRSGLFIMLAGLVVFGLGVMPYLISPAHRSLNERIYYYASAGASLTVIMALYLIVGSLRGGQTLFAIIGSICVGLGMVQVVSQLDILKTYYLTQQRLLTQLTQQAPAFTKGTTLVLLDETGKFQSTFWLFDTSSRLEMALSYLYQDYSLHVVLCYPQLPNWGLVFEHCSFEKTGFVWQTGDPANAGTANIPYDNLIVFRYTPDEHLVLANSIPDNDDLATIAAPLYQPLNHIHQAATTNVRFRQLLLPEVLSTTPPAVGSFRVDVGVKDALPDGIGIWSYRTTPLPDGSTWRWTIAKRVDLMLPPLQTGAYTAKLRVLNVSPNTVWQTVKLAMNGTPIPTTYDLDANGNILYTGEISADLVQQDAVNDLGIRVDDLFKTPGIDLGVGLAMDWVEVTKNN